MSIYDPYGPGTGQLWYYPYYQTHCAGCRCFQNYGTFWFENTADSITITKRGRHERIEDELSE